MAEPSLDQLEKQIAVLQARAAQMRGGQQPTANPYSIATQMSTGAKAAADAADAMMPQAPGAPVPRPDSSPVPVPGQIEVSPEEQRARQIEAALRNVGFAGAMLQMGRPPRRPITSSKMPRDPYDDYAAAQMQGVIARELGGMGGIGGFGGMPNIAMPKDPQNIFPRRPPAGEGGEVILLGADRANSAFNNFLRSSPADQAKLEQRAASAGMDVRNFLSLSSLDQYKAINGTLGQPTPSSVATGRPRETTRYTANGAETAFTNTPQQFPGAAQTRIDARGVQITNYPSGAVTMLGPGVRGAGVPANSPRASSEVARELTYRSNLAGAALNSLNRPSMRFGF